MTKLFLMRTLLVVLILCVQVASGQQLKETRTASLVDGDYSLEGTVYLELFDNNDLKLRFGSDYLTQSNVFDVHVFLSTTNNYQSPIDTSNMLLVSNIGTESGLNYSSGAMTFNLPSEVAINDYKYIVFVCVKYGQLHWGNGVFGEVTLSSTEFDENRDKLPVDIYPNPSKNGKIEILFKTPQQNLLIEVFDVKGQMLSSERVLWKQQHFLELKNSGMYFLRFTSYDTSLVRKIIRL